MSRIAIPHRLRLAFIWGAAFTLLLGFRFESDYRYRLGHLPALVDEHGTIGSVEDAMASLDLYQQIKQIRLYGFVSLSVGLLLCASAAATKPRREGHDVVA